MPNNLKLWYLLLVFFFMPIVIWYCTNYLGEYKGAPEALIEIIVVLVMPALVYNILLTLMEMIKE